MFGEGWCWHYLDEAMSQAFTRPENAWQLAEQVAREARALGYEQIHRCAEDFLTDMFNHLPGVRIIKRLLDIVDR